MVGPSISNKFLESLRLDKVVLNIGTEVRVDALVRAPLVHCSDA